MRVRLPVLVAFFLASSWQLFAQRGPFTVGTITARPGEMASGMMVIPAATDPGTELPVTIFHGVQHGPVLALVAGNHGREFSPILALQRVRALLDPREIRGTVILVHVANMPSFLRRTIYFNPIDDKNLNRMYPGKKDGTSSERIAYATRPR